jgi:predicted DNA-binding transcriptional regulator YafY
MPDAKHHQAIARQWEILRMVPRSPPGVTAQEVTARLNDVSFEVSRRTVERNLKDLSQVFGFHCDDSQEPYRWHFMDKAAIDIRSLTVTEAVSTRLVEDLLRPLLPQTLLGPLEDRFLHARKKIEALGDHVQLANWAKKVRYVPTEFPRLPPPINEQVQQVVHEALIQTLQFKVDYGSRNGPLRQGRILNPHALIQKGPVSYVVANTPDDSKLKFFALHRMSNAVLTYEPCQLMNDFDLDDFVRDGHPQFKTSDMPIRLEAWVSVDLAGTLSERPLSVDQTLVPCDKGFVLTATVNDSLDLVPWIMSMGPDITVNAPSSLRLKIVGKLEHLSRAYHIGSANM